MPWQSAYGVDEDEVEGTCTGFACGGGAGLTSTRIFWPEQYPFAGHERELISGKTPNRLDETFLDANSP